MAQVNLPPGFELVSAQQAAVKLPPGFQLVDERAPQPSTPRSEAGMGIDASTVAGANAARVAAVRIGEELATSPAVGKVIGMVSGPVARKTAAAVGAHAGGLAGYAAGEVLTSPVVGEAVETGIRATGANVARLAGSRLAETLTGAPMTALTLPGMPFNATPVGETRVEAERAIQQSMYAHRRMSEINRAVGKQPIKGNTTQEILESIAEFERKHPHPIPTAADYAGGM